MYCAYHQDWATDFKLFESGVRVNPLNVKLRNNYGIELKTANRVEEAMYQYKVCNPLISRAEGSWSAQEGRHGQRSQPDLCQYTVWAVGVEFRCAHFKFWLRVLCH